TSTSISLFAPKSSLKTEPKRAISATIQRRQKLAICSCEAPSLLFVATLRISSSAPLGSVVLCLVILKRGRDPGLILQAICCRVKRIYGKHRHTSFSSKIGIYRPQHVTNHYKHRIAPTGRSRLSTAG